MELGRLGETGGCLTQAFIHQYRWRTTIICLLTYVYPTVHDFLDYYFFRLEGLARLWIVRLLGNVPYVVQFRAPGEL